MYCNVIKFLKQESLEFLLESRGAASGPNVYRKGVPSCGTSNTESTIANFNAVRGTSKVLLSADRRVKCCHSLDESAQALPRRLRRCHDQADVESDAGVSAERSMSASPWPHESTCPAYRPSRCQDCALTPLAAERPCRRQQFYSTAQWWRWTEPCI